MVFITERFLEIALESWSERVFAPTTTKFCSDTLSD